MRGQKPSPAQWLACKVAHQRDVFVLPDAEIPGPRGPETHNDILVRRLLRRTASLILIWVLKTPKTTQNDRRFAFIQG
jgi:hypothetical protein